MLPSRHQAACALVRANSSSSTTTLLRQAAAAAPSRSSLRNSSSHSAPSNEASRSEAPPLASRPDSWSRLQRPTGAALPRSAEMKAAIQSAIATAQVLSDLPVPHFSINEEPYASLPPLPEAESKPVSAMSVAAQEEALRPEAARWSSRWDWRMTSPSRYGETLRGRVCEAPEHNVKRIQAPVSILRGGQRSPELKDDVRRYVATQTMLLDLERKVGERELAERREWSSARLEHTGVGIDRLGGHWRSQRKYGRRVAHLQLSAKRLFPWTRIKVGDGVELFPSVDESAASTRPRAQPFGSAFGHQEPQPIFDPDEENLPRLKSTEALIPPSEQPKKLRPEPIKATVLAISANHMTLSFEGTAAYTDVEGSKWLVIQGRNNQVHKRLIDALACLSYVLEVQEKALPPPLTPTASPEVLGELGITPNELILRGTDLVDVLLGHASAEGGGCFKGDAMLESWVNARGGTGKVVEVEGDPKLGLNRSQERAVAMMLGNRLSLVQGPPGTGKTHTIVAAVKLLKLHFQVPHPILLCAHTNVAVDNLALGAKRAGLKVVRAGDGTRLTHEELRGCTLDEMIEDHPKKSLYDDMRSRLIQMRMHCYEQEQAVRTREEAQQLSPAALYAHLAKLQSRIKEIKLAIAKLHTASFMLEQSMLSEVLRDADVICCTSLASTSARLRAIDFPVVFFDEGSQATEAINLVPLMKGAKHLAIIGDHKQLPPVVASVEARKLGLGLSLFERLINRGDVPSTMLDTQHRMHPALSEFPNAAFYAGALQNGASTSAIAPLRSAYLSPGDGASTNEGTPHERLVFITHANEEVRSDKSLQNEGEAQLVGRILVDLLVQNPELMGVDVGVVAPYAAQVRLLQRMLHEPDSAERHVLEGLWEEAGHRARASQLAAIEVHTVDGFEGREKRAIVFSSTRSNDQGNVGFLADARRLCVALTRAKSGLWIVGNLPTWEAAKLTEAGAEAVETDDTQVLKEYVEWMESRGLVVEDS